MATASTFIDPALIAALTAAAEGRDGHPERGEIRFRCPFPGHLDNHPSARWNPEKGTFFCDVCGKGGGAIDLAKLLGIELPKFSPNGHDTPRGLTLQQYAIAKRLPLAFLQGLGLRDARYSGNPAVETLYLDENGTIEGKRYRTALTGKDRFKWRKGDHICLYGRDRRQLALDRGYGILVGGESDSQTLWFHDEPAFGLAGEGTWNDERDASTLDDIPAVYVVIEPDQGGEALRKKLNTSRLRDRLRVVDLMSMYGFKDPSALYLNDPDQFPDRWAKAKASGRPLNSSYVHMFARDESNIDAPELPTFPVDVFPDAIRKYVIEGAESHNVPPDMIALPLLGFASGVIGNTIAVHVKPGWIERPILWIAIVGDPGSGKSHAIDYARAPLDVLQREAWDQYQQKLTEWEEAIAEAKAKKDRTDPLPEKPDLQHFFSTDATPEALASMLSMSPGINVVRDELVGWVKSHDAYRKAGDRQLHLSLWAGTPMKVDRKGAGSTYIPRPSVSVVGGVQPELLTELAEEANRRDGFVERILMAWPQARPMTWNEATIDSTAAWEVEYIFRKLRVRVMGTDSDIVLKFNSEARRVFGNWYNDNSRIIAETSGIASGCYAKYPGQLARIALVLHCLHHPGDTTTNISSQTVEDAIEVIEYLRQHLIRILPSFGASGSTKTASLEGRILRILGKAEGDWVARRELTRGLGNSVPSDDIRVVLEQLEIAAKVENRIVPTGSRPREESRLLVSQQRTYEHMNKSPNGTAPNGAYVHMRDGEMEGLDI